MVFKPNYKSWLSKRNTSCRNECCELSCQNSATHEVFRQRKSIVDKRSLTATELFEKDPTRVVEKAVKGMLPKNKLGACLRNYPNHSSRCKTNQTIVFLNPRRIKINCDTHPPSCLPTQSSAVARSFGYFFGRDKKVRVNTISHGFMGIVLLCLILGLAIAIERIIFLNLSTTNTAKLTENVRWYGYLVTT